jgi:hypothetical protein
MKKIIIALILLSNYCFAQSENDLVTVLGQLRQTQLYKNCQEFKMKMDTQTRKINEKITSKKQSKDLEEAYISVWQKYDFFLKTIKQDLIDKQKLQILTSDPNGSTDQYLALMEDVNQEYKARFAPIYGGKDILEDILKVGFGLVKNIVQKIQTRKMQKNEALNNILPQVNKYFYDNLYLKSWSELDLSNAINSSNSQTVNVPTSTLSSIEGDIQFIQVSNSEESPMEFEQNNGKDIIVDNESGKTYKTPYFNSLANYKIGTKFKIIANADAFIYVIVLNTDGIKLLHPYVLYVQKGKDIDVIKESMPTTGKVILPKEGLFTIVTSKDGSEKDSEDFALIISKSELIMEETIEKINAVTGNLDERFSQVFSDQQITYEEAQVKVSGNQFNFSYQKTDKNILPMVFKIRR